MKNHCLLLLFNVVLLLLKGTYFCCTNLFNLRFKIHLRTRISAIPNLSFVNNVNNRLEIIPNYFSFFKYVNHFRDVFIYNRNIKNYVSDKYGENMCSPLLPINKRTFFHISLCFQGQRASFTVGFSLWKSFSP